MARISLGNVYEQKPLTGAIIDTAIFIAPGIVCIADYESHPWGCSLEDRSLRDDSFLNEVAFAMEKLHGFRMVIK